VIIHVVHHILCIRHADSHLYGSGDVFIAMPIVAGQRPPIDAGRPDFILIKRIMEGIVQSQENVRAIEFFGKTRQGSFRSQRSMPHHIHIKVLRLYLLGVISLGRIAHLEQIFIQIPVVLVAILFLHCQRIMTDAERFVVLHHEARLYSHVAELVETDSFEWDVRIGFQHPVIAVKRVIGKQSRPFIINFRHHIHIVARQFLASVNLYLEPIHVSFLHTAAGDFVKRTGFVGIRATFLESVGTQQFLFERLYRSDMMRLVAAHGSTVGIQSGFRFHNRATAILLRIVSCMPDLQPDADVQAVCFRH